MLFEKEYFLYIINSEGEKELLRVMKRNEMCIAITEIGNYKSFETHLEFCETVAKMVDDNDLYFVIIKAATSTCWIEEKTIWRNW